MKHALADIERHMRRAKASDKEKTETTKAKAKVRVSAKRVDEFFKVGRALGCVARLKPCHVAACSLSVIAVRSLRKLTLSCQTDAACVLQRRSGSHSLGRHFSQ